MIDYKIPEWTLEMKKKASERMKKRWRDKRYREFMISGQIKNKHPWRQSYPSKI